MVKGVGKAERQREAGGALELVKLPGYGARRPGQLSGGQRQRVALARALVNRPKVLLLDEPLGALDLKLREQMQEELKALQKALGITFVFVTHDQGEALSMADRVAVFNHGRIEQVGTPEDDLPEARRRASSPISSARPTCCRPDFVQRLGGDSGAGRACGPRPSGSTAPAPSPPRSSRAYLGGTTRLGLSAAGLRINAILPACARTGRGRRVTLAFDRAEPASDGGRVMRRRPAATAPP